MNVQITIKGNAVLFQIKGVWHALFVTDDCHEFKYNGVPYAPPAGTVRTVTISPTGAAAATPVRLADLDDYINMSHARLHGHSSGSKKLKVQLSMEPHHGYVHLIIPSGRLRAGGHSAKPYKFLDESGNTVWERDSPSVSVFELEFGATYISASYVDWTPGNLSASYEPLQADEKAKATSMDEVSSSSEMSHLTFDNDCQKTSAHKNDFLHIYEWLKGSRKFDSVPKDALLGVIVPEGNCDPVIVEPAPDIGP
jgi:hypothetical protein